MKKRVFSALGLAAFLLLSSASYAFETTAQTDSPEYLTLKHAGEHYQALAGKFGCDKFAWAAFVSGGKIADLEFVPEETRSIEDWTRLMTVTLYSLSGKQDTDVKLMAGILDGLMGQYKKADAKIIRTEYFQTERGDPGMYLEYEVGRGAMTEHNAGVFMRTSSTTAAFIQIQSRGATLAAADAAQVRELIQPVASKQ